MKQAKVGVSEQQVSATDQNTPQRRSRVLFIRVDTFDKDGHGIGSRIVDMYHFGTAGWLQKHLWWAFHNGHTVENNVAKDEEVQEHIVAQKQALADKYNNKRTHEAA